MLGPRFHALARGVSHFTGSAACFALAAGSVLVWAITGPIFHYSEMWQLIINTGTTIVTFLMVFLIQNAQNRDTEAIQIKLDELIRATEGARNALLDLEELEPDQLAAFRGSYTRLARRAKNPADTAVDPTGIAEIQLEALEEEPVGRTTTGTRPRLASSP
ncbi:MAG TPA: low affinity iron permease family protein [Xanthomonadaceae bacterium]|jgi:low affinity Fe/Cu permease